MATTLDDDILELSLWFWKIIGEHMHFTSKKLQIWRMFNIFALVVALWFTVLKLGHSVGVEYMRVIEGTTNTAHILLKYVTFIYYKSNIEELLDDRARFWNYEDFGNELLKKINIIFGYVKFIQHYSLAAIIFVTLIYWLRPHFEDDTKFMYDCWVYPDSIVLETIVLACQYYTLAAAIPIILAYDFFYFAYAVHVALQLRRLRQKLKIITANTKIEEIYQCINYHQFMLSLFKRFSSVYSTTLLFHYFLTFTAACTQLYIILLGQADIRKIIALMLYNITLFLEFGYYAFPADIIVDELQNIANAIYASSWYEQNIRVQKTLMFIIMQAQRQKYMLAGGIVAMNISRCFYFCYTKNIFLLHNYQECIGEIVKLDMQNLINRTEKTNEFILNKQRVLESIPIIIFYLYNYGLLLLKSIRELKR